MKTASPFYQRARILILLLAIAALMPATWAGAKSLPKPRMVKSFYQPFILVSDGFTSAPNTDPNLVNPWGLAFGPGTFAWVANNGTGVSTLHDGFGTPQPLIVEIPGPDDSPDLGAPTGIVFNEGNCFRVTSNTLSLPARFLFATEDGVIAGWNPDAALNRAILAVDRSSFDAIYKGLAIAMQTTRSKFSKGKKNPLPILRKQPFLYATDFHNAKIDVFDCSFTLVQTPGQFVDRSIPKGFAPFGIQNICGFLYVTYAKQDAEGEDDVAGQGLGFVRIFNPEGFLVNRLVSHTGLNAPWGLALAPKDFGKLSNHLLVGNFGDGTISAYDPLSGKFEGKLRDPLNKVVEIDGLWAIVFGNGAHNQPKNTLFFTAGPNDEADGLYGRIEALFKFVGRPKN